MAISLVALLASWVLLARRHETVRREICAASLVVWAVLGAFSWAGLGRTDGFCFNQRYLLELVPLGALSLAWSVDRYEIRPLPLLAGTLVAALAAGLFLGRDADDAIRQIAVARVPLALAALLLAAWGLAALRHGSDLLAIALGGALMWATVVHLADDLRATNRVRRGNLWAQRAMADKLPDGAALIGWGPIVQVVAPLRLQQRLLAVDASRDKGRDAARVLDELRAKGHRVFVVATAFPPPLLAALLEGRRVETLVDRPRLLEVR